MPQSVTLFCPRDWSLGTLAGALEARLGGEGIRVNVFPDQVELRVGLEYAARFTEASNERRIVEEYGLRDEIDRRFHDSLGSLRAFFFWFQDFDVVREALRRVLRFAEERGDELWVDSDYGWVVDGRTFLRRISGDVAADWRTEDPWEPDHGN